MFNHDWFYYCYNLEKEKEKLLVFPTWKNTPQISYTNVPFYLHNSTNFNSKIDSYLLLSLYKNNMKFYCNNSTDIKSLLPHQQTNTYLPSNLFTKFVPLRKSSFISFFIDNMVDVPTCFKKSHSLTNKTFELPLLKFTNLIMRKGKREQALKIIIQAVNSLFLTLKQEKIDILGNYESWFNLYTYLTNVVSISQTYLSFDSVDSYNLIYNNHGLSDSKLINNDFFFRSFFLSRLSQITPVFSFFVYNVDKNIRKYSRGKSGKYVFIWKYIPSYKRLFITMRWIIKDIKFNGNKKLADRVTNSLLKLTLEPRNSFSFKSHFFAHNYVFRNLKKTLMTSLRTTA